MQTADERDRFSAIGRLSHHLKAGLGLEQLAKTDSEHLVVVGDQQSDGGRFFVGGFRHPFTLDPLGRQRESSGHRADTSMDTLEVVIDSRDVLCGEVIAQNRLGQSTLASPKVERA